MTQKTRAPHGGETIDISALTPDPQNARRHNPTNIGMIGDALQDVGAWRSIGVDEHNTVYMGSGVLEAAVERGFRRVVVVESDGETLIAVRRRGLTVAQKQKAAIYDNRTAELSDWDSAAIQSLCDAGVALDDVWSHAELRQLLARGAAATEDGAAPPRRETSIVRGDVFALGDHRVMCGDCTCPEDVSRLLAGATPHLCVTDPPYGVSYDPAWRTRAARAGYLSFGPRRVGPIANDDRSDWRAAWALFPGDVLYSWHPAGATSLVHAAAIQDSGFVLRAQIIWAKRHLAIGRGDYHAQHEPCWYAVRAGKPSRRTRDRTQTTLWEIALDATVPGGHPTQKPVECMARPIRNHESAAVYDPFLGSGTTVIAAEQLQRVCYGMEIDPPYCQVSLDRWEACTGRQATQIAGGGG